MTIVRIHTKSENTEWIYREPNKTVLVSFVRNAINELSFPLRAPCTIENRKQQLPKPLILLLLPVLSIYLLEIQIISYYASSPHNIHFRSATTLKPSCFTTPRLMLLNWNLSDSTLCVNKVRESTKSIVVMMTKRSWNKFAKITAYLEFYTKA